MGARKLLWVTGAGGGMGRASAEAAARAGWTVAVSGRRPEAVAETAEAIRSSGGDALAVPVDVQDADALRDAHAKIVAERGEVTGLVLAAGANTPRRMWADQSLEEFASVVDVNLLGVVRPIHLVLPGMRREGEGTIIVVSSRAAWRFSPDAGVGYMASKSALGVVVASLNDQERLNGVRACHLCPGEVDTDFLELRPEVPSAAQRAAMLSPDDIGRVTQFVLDSPAHVRIDELSLSPIGQR